jgi:hypothetical protein
VARAGNGLGQRGGCEVDDFAPVARCKQGSRMFLTSSNGGFSLLPSEGAISKQ